MAMVWVWLALQTFWIYSSSMWYVYVLESKIDNQKYVGLADNLARRIKLHNSGKVFSTKNRKPLGIIYCEVYLNKNDAAAREQFLKSGWGKNYLGKVLSNYIKSKKLGG